MGERLASLERRCYPSHILVVWLAVGPWHCHGPTYSMLKEKSNNLFIVIYVDMQST